MRDYPGITQLDATAADMRSVGMLMPFLAHLQERGGARSEWRKLENNWLVNVLDRPVIAFADAQIAAELLARHEWEDVQRLEDAQAPRAVAALKRLSELRLRRASATLR